MHMILYGIAQVVMSFVVAKNVNVNSWSLILE